MTIPMISIRGGLGNQLFQWFYGHTVHRDEKFKLHLDYDIRGKSNRKFELKPLMASCNHYQTQEYKHISSLFSNPLIYNVLDKTWDLPSMRSITGLFGYYREDPRFDYEQSNKVPSHVRFANGYFQHSKNIENNLHRVREELVPYVESVLTKVKQKFRITEKYSVLHVRRGDYFQNYFDSTIIGALDDNYFLGATKNLHRFPLIILVEDSRDIEQLKKMLKVSMILDRHNTSSWETLAIMSGATQLIGSNSSLSWWGARLCSLSGGEVWLPEDWSYWRNILPENYDFPNCHRIPSTWIVN